MNDATGCISIAVTGPRGAVTVDRLIEYFCPADDSCAIWIDVFFTHSASERAEMFVLHRGGFSGQDVSCKSWTTDENGESSFERSLTERIVRLHHDYGPIEIRRDGTVSLDGKVYRVWREADRDPLFRCAGSDHGDDVPPFTMWNVGPLGDPGRYVFRTRLEMSPSTFAAGIGRSRSFVAYGESILMATIENEDLPNYGGPEHDAYETALDLFRAADHVTPQTFEYLVISPESTPLEWETTPLSPGLERRCIESPVLNACTHWFVPDDRTNFLLGGNSYRGFAVGLSARAGI